MLTQQQVVGVVLVLEGQTAEAHVVQVLEPLEEGDGHTAAVLHNENNYLPI
jgi:hypothetical protein